MRRSARPAHPCPKEIFAHNERAAPFQGSWAHIESGTGGCLEITSELDSFAIDANRTITAEACTQFVILELPEGADTEGDFEFNFNFTVPDTMTSVEMKPLFTGRVDTTTGDTFDLPLLPCEPDMASVPPVNVPLPSGGLVALPVTSVQGCDGEVYALAPMSDTLPVYLPLMLKN